MDRTAAAVQRLAAALVARPAVPLGDLLRMQVDLERAAGVPVDLHEVDRLPVDLQFRVVREGTVVVDRDRAARVRREIEIMNAHDDLAPYLERIRSGARQRLARSASDHG